VAEKGEKSVSIPWLPLLTLIGVGSGVLLLFPQLISSRPGGGDTGMARSTFDDQTTDARLWQDPLGVAVADWEKNQNDRKAHSIQEFRERLAQRCFAEQTKDLQILAVMMPGGPYVENVERRLRDRRAVIEGLALANYDPENDHEIGYFYVPWEPLQPTVVDCVLTLQRNRDEDENRPFSKAGINQPRQSKESNDQELERHSLLVPYEWLEQTTFGPKKEPLHVLVLWLNDDAFRDAPLARLADLASWFRLKHSGSSPDDVFPPLPFISVLGPDNSGTLHKMVLEAQANRWDKETRQCLATMHIYSSQASAADSRLLSEISFEHTCKDLIERNVKLPESDNGFCFERTNLPDDQIVETMRQELARRGVEKNDYVAIISEEDTYYARALCSSFIDSDVKGPFLGNVHSYTYLRGIDGKLPSDRKEDKEVRGTAEGGDKNIQSSLQPTERPEGLNQADYVRRLAMALRNQDRKLRGGEGKGIKAVGLLGSDIYDKLELLKALRPMLPQAVFFTNNLDARMFHPDEWSETHNLVVVAAPDLVLENYENVPPFRDSWQTALFEATLAATGSTKAVSLTRSKEPLIFEISRYGPIKMSITADKGNKELSHLFESYVPRLGAFILFGSLLLAWPWFVSKITSASSNGKDEAEQSNEHPDGTAKHVEAA
jgi:hypothetical protein